MRFKILLAIFLFFLFCVKVFSQSTEAEVKKVAATTEGNTIIINYNIEKSSRKEKYKTSLLFRTNESTWIIPKTIKGDVNTFIKGGKNKTIQWDVLKDTVGISCKITPYVRITGFTEKLGGPANALYSLLAPGMGDYGVTKNEDLHRCFYKPYFTTILAYGSLGYGIFQKIRSDQFYSKYKDTWSQSEIDSYYKKANSGHKQYIIAVSVAASIWIADIAYVIYKGITNKQNEKKEKKSGVGGLYLNYDQTGGMQTGYFMRF